MEISDEHHMAEGGEMEEENHSDNNVESADNGTTSVRKQFLGPCYLKMLVNKAIAGSVIGKSGKLIAFIEKETGSCMKLSPSAMYFPGTNDRVVLISGSQDSVSLAMLAVFAKAKEYYQANNQKDNNDMGTPSMKIVVPRSSVSNIMGLKGSHIKALQEKTGARVQVTNRHEMITERVITISGASENVEAAATEVCSSIQMDPYLKEYVHIAYSPTMSGGMITGKLFAGNRFDYPRSYMLADSNCEIDIHVPDHLAGPIIGKNGTSLHDITYGLNAKIRLSPKGELMEGTTNRKCTISGSVRAVHVAHIRLLEKLDAAGHQQRNNYDHISGESLAARREGSGMNQRSA